jgi:hypothetical protein
MSTKKVKKISVIIISVIFLLLISQQLYYRFENGGNLIFLLSNDYSWDTPLSYEIYLDGKKVFEGQMTETYHTAVIKTSLNFHKVVVKINDELSPEIKFNTFLVAFVLVDYHGNRALDGENRFSIRVQRHHLIFLA